jgi:hypothetical protein
MSYKPKPPPLFTGGPRPVRKYPFTAQILTLDRSPLPLELNAAAKVHNRFSAFHPIAAGTGITKQARPTEAQLSWSWICFSTKDHLDAFVSANQCASFSSGKTIVAERCYRPGIISLTTAERMAKQLEDQDRIREERRKTRLLKEEPMCVYGHQLELNVKNLIE